MGEVGLEAHCLWGRSVTWMSFHPAWTFSYNRLADVSYTQSLYNHLLLFCWFCILSIINGANEHRCTHIFQMWCSCIFELLPSYAIIESYKNPIFIFLKTFTLFHGCWLTHSIYQNQTLTAIRRALNFTQI